MGSPEPKLSYQLAFISPLCMTLWVSGRRLKDNYRPILEFVQDYPKIQVDDHRRADFLFPSKVGRPKSRKTLEDLRQSLKDPKFTQLAALLNENLDIGSGRVPEVWRLFQLHQRTDDTLKILLRHPQTRKALSREFRRSWQGETCLHWAVRMENLVALRHCLQQAYVHVNKVNKAGQTALYQAVVQDSLPLVEVLLKFNACPDAPTREGDTPASLILASKSEGLRQVLTQSRAQQDYLAENMGKLPWKVSAFSQDMIHADLIAPKLVLSPIGYQAEGQMGPENVVVRNPTKARRLPHA